NNQPVRGSCDVYNNNSRWYISNWTQSCPAGWTKLANNRCVDANSINGVCSKCSNPFVCKYASGVLNEEGKCVIDEAICPVGSVCDSGDQKCKKTDTGKCDCCCRKDNQNEDCCEGLICDGTCGSGGSNLGFCSGCVINGVPNDDVCNCFGHNGKFCDATSDPRGICVDCSAITNLEECSRHSACCVDGKNNNRCSGIVEGGSSFENNGLMYCSYFNCTNTYPNSCNENPFITGVYNKITTCQQGCTSAPIYCSLNQATCENPKCPEEMYCNLSSCECLSRDPNVGEPCIDPITQSCTGQCNTGYQCLLPDGYGGGAGDCLCCCKPPSNPNEPDSCQQINSNLSCLPNKTPCTSQTNQRGLCCGCSKDSECGKDVSRTGCSAIDRCCRNRPAVTAYLPAINEENVCRNTVVEATFNQIIDPSTLGITDQTSIPNVTLIADYGLSSCSSDGYYPVAEAYQPNSRLASIIFSLKKLAVRIFPSLITKPAFAAVKNYCYIPGTALAYNINASQTRVTYRLTKALKAYVDYYVVLKGDADLVNNIEKDFYNANITSLEKIGMVGYAQGGASDAFNNTTFKNAEIWKFTTGSDICALEKVKVEPNFYLFQRPAQEGSLVATALDRNNNEIQPLNNFYSWDWSWLIDDSEIAEIRPGPEPQKFTATVVSKNKQDAQTLVRAKSTIVVDKFNQPSTVGRSREGISTIRVFLCENPWPVYKPNYAWPWQDQTTGIEFYYCRDKNNSGTFDDLPALTNPPIANQGGRKICMFGQNSGKTCTSDANCNNLIGSCLPEVLKEYFFFREITPGVPVLQGSVDPLGKKVTLEWAAVPNATKYKIYYGLSSGQYAYNLEVTAVSGTNNKTIDNLVNGLNYYFAVTALTDKNSESFFSNEVKLKPQDITPPAIPSLQASAGDGKITLFWNSVPEAVSYIAYLGTMPKNDENEYAFSVIVRTIPPANTPNVIFTGVNGGPLNENTDYYVSVRSVDQYGNISNYAPEIIKRTNEPYLISLEK
ncbi:MAG: fibronectin type III domain-containing protein, partial [Candidatus Nanoarchaeia archaeon]